MQSVDVRIVNKLGLHARAAVKFVSPPSPSKAASMWKRWAGG